MAGGFAPAEIIALGVSVVNVLGTAFSQISEHPDSRYREKVKKLQKDRWSQVSTELGDILYRVEDKVEDTEIPEGEELTEAALYSYVIQRELDAGEVSGLTTLIEDVDVPKEIFQQIREKRDKSFKSFGGGLIGSILGGLIYYLSTPDTSGTAVGIWVLAFGVMLSLNGVNCALDWFNHRTQLDELWEEFDFM